MFLSEFSQDYVAKISGSFTRTLIFFFRKQHVRAIYLLNVGIGH